MNLAQKIRSSNWLSSRLPFYYGWIMLAVAMLTSAATSPGQTFGVSIFNPSFLSTFNISLSQLTGAYMVGTLLASIPQPYIGNLMDRYGIRRTMTGVVLLFGLACGFIAITQSYPMLFVAFFFLRLLGQGALGLLSSNIPAMWFDRRLGQVSSYMSGGFASANAIVPPVILWLITAYGWRNAYVILGISVWTIVLPILFLIFRNRPEDVVQFLDGVDMSSPEHGQTSAKEDAALVLAQRSFTLKAAQRTPAYWIMIAISTTFSLINTAIFFNLLPFFDSKGLSNSTAAATFTTLAVVSIITQLITGPIADMVPLNRLLSLALFIFTAAIGVLLIMTTPWQSQVYAILIGIAQGIFGVTGGTLWARYFGRKHLGKIRGTIMTAGVAGSSVGPFIMGLIYDWTGTYHLSLYIFAGITLPIAIAALWAKKPAQIQTI